jgi:pimeloyl-ACP methyl ester carboxylesterase
MIAGVMLAYFAICAVLYSFQERLLFFPQPNHPEIAAVLTPWAVELDAGLQGWIISPAAPGARPLIYYFGGNGEDVSHTALNAVQRGDVNLVVINYAGYGGSAGTPGEARLFADALAIFDQTVASIPNNGHIVAMGRSLGSGVAVHLAHHRPLTGLILVTPYDSIARVAQRHYPLLPVDLLLVHRFDSIAMSRGLSVQALFLVAQEDPVVPVEHARRLADAWEGAVTWRQFESTDHNSIGNHPEYWPAILDFLD